MTKKQLYNTKYRAKPGVKEARKSYNRGWYLRNAERSKANSRDSRLRLQYGLSLEKYAEMFTAQNGVCAICKKPQGEGIKSLAVDHDHETGKVRELLCRACNRGIGMFKDNPATLEAAARYCERHNKI